MESRDLGFLPSLPSDKRSARMLSLCNMLLTVLFFPGFLIPFCQRDLLCLISANNPNSLTT